jgi:putative component of membrane protein insertase Oxa1/YidC/SpoIIIJ protein YidD
MRLVFSAAIVTAILVVLPAPARAEDDGMPQLWEPDQAVAYLLTGRASPPAAEQTSRWDGALAGGVSRALFGTYHLVFASQDSANCLFSPSCSRFSQKAIGTCGLLEGTLLTLDRLLRDHPMAVPFYPRAEGGHLLRDEPARYCLTRPE